MQSRRSFLKTSSLLLQCFVAGRVVLLTPAEARAADLPLQTFSRQEAATLEAIAEAIVPGSVEAGIAQFIDKQLAAPPDEMLLMLKYLDVPAPFAHFYQSGLQSADRAAQAAYGANWAGLNAAQTTALSGDMSQDQIANWQGFPASFLLFVLRADACDVVYGTEQGFASIGMPYRAHITPPQNW